MEGSKAREMHFVLARKKHHCDEGKFTTSLETVAFWWMLLLTDYGHPEFFQMPQIFWPTGLIGRIICDVMKDIFLQKN